MTKEPSVNSRRAAPPISFVNADQARLNIQRKYDYLFEFLKKKSELIEKFPERDWNGFQGKLPKSIAQFNHWTSENIPPLDSSLEFVFGRNSNATLNKHETLKGDISTILGVVKVGSGEVPRLEAAAALKRKLAMANSLRKIAERALLRAREQVRTLNEEKAELSAELEAQAKKVRELLDSSKAENKRLQSLTAELTAQAKRQSGLKAV